MFFGPKRKKHDLLPEWLIFFTPLIAHQTCPGKHILATFDSLYLMTILILFLANMCHTKLSPAGVCPVAASWGPTCCCCCCWSRCSFSTACSAGVGPPDPLLPSSSCLAICFCCPAMPSTAIALQAAWSNSSESSAYAHGELHSARGTRARLLGRVSACFSGSGGEP